MRLALTYHTRRERIKRIISARRKLKWRATRRKKIKAHLAKMLSAGLHLFSHKRSHPSAEEPNKKLLNISGWGDLRSPSKATGCK